MFVLLQRGAYFWVCEATSKKHFALEDAGWRELMSGTKEECLIEESFLNQKEGIIELYCDDTKSLIQTTEEMLNVILELNPDYLNNKEFL